MVSIMAHLKDQAWVENKAAGTENALAIKTSNPMGPHLKMFIFYLLHKFLKWQILVQL